MFEGTDRCRQLEGALVVCQEEIRVYLDQMEESKDRHDQAAAARDEQVGVTLVEVAGLHLLTYI